MAVEITETPRHTLTVSEQNWQLKLSTVGVADLPDNATFNNVTVNNLLTADHIHGNIAGQLYIHVEAQEDLTKGDPIYISGFNSGTSQPKVRRARADDALKMPAIGVIDATYTAGSQGANCIISGLIEDVNTQGFGINNPVYVGLTGGFTATKPSSNVQQIGICDRDQQNSGSFVVTAQSVSSNQDLNTTDDVTFNNLYTTNYAGINTTSSPTSPLVVQTDGDEKGIELVNSSSASRFKVRTYTDQLYMSLYNTSNTETVRISTVGNSYFTGGNVGIGVASPFRSLHISTAMRLEPSTTPSNPSAGDIYFDSSTNKLRCFDGTTWNNLF